ncbi:MAG: hypothetical protein LBT00_08450 [Spirochaetaceae bacterium]|jgi:hypothetical protein|nr:hypothetical protein [Spirochaetaceae bacterium]
MDRHSRKKRGPVIAAICIAGYYAAGTVLVSALNVPGIVKIAVVAASVAITAVTIAVLVERIKEIDGGEEDDLGKY